MLEEWFSQKFVEPLCRYYTLEATLTYGIILALVGFGVYYFLKKNKINIDKYFFLSLLPFIVYGGWTRALRDHGIYEGWIFCSPPIYFFVFAITFVSLLVSLVIEKLFKIKYYLTMGAIGSIFVLYNIILTRINNFDALLMILALVGFWGIVFFGIHKKWSGKLSLVNAGIIIAHLVDASSSFVSINFFGYCEQHVLTGVLMGAYCNAQSLPSLLNLPFMPWMIFPLKIVFVWGALYLLDKNSDDKKLNNFLKIIILILGLALGIRDMLTVSMLVI